MIVQLNPYIFTFSPFDLTPLPMKNIRQHALSILTDLFLKKYQQQKHQSDSGNASSVTIFIPTDRLCLVLSEICIPLAGRRIVQLQRYPNSKDASISNIDQLMMEFELCIGLIFKPLRQHLHSIISMTATSTASPDGCLTQVWTAVLSVIENLFSPSSATIIGSDPTDIEYDTSYSNHSSVISDELIATMNSLAKEHLQSAILTLVSLGVLSFPSSPELSPNVGDVNEALTKQTWISVRKMGITDKEIEQWT